MEKIATKVVTGKARLSYAHIWEPQAIEEGQDKKYSVAVLIPKSDKVTLGKIKKVVEDIKAASSSKWGGKVPKTLKLPLRDGDVDRDDEVYAGHYFFNASSKQKPKIVDKDLNEILDKDEVYSGCYARVSVNFYAFNKNGNMGIAAGLGNIQKLADGERLGGGSSPEDDFGDDFEDDGFLD